ncbi:glycerate kinase [Cupriavidus sp. PET2-C1]
MQYDVPTADCIPIAKPQPSLRVLIAPDSFKGCLDAPEVAARLAAGVRAAIPDCQVWEAPIADGGEGTARAVALALSGSWHLIRVLDANGELAQIPFAACSSPALGDFALFDVAAVVGLPDAVALPGLRTTRGVGQAIRAIAELGHRTIVLGLGGSSTNDGGAGLLAELAFSFADANGRPIEPTLNSLPQIQSVSRRIDTDWLDDIRLIGLTDVTSPLCGPNGASHVFGPQKGFVDLAEADRALRDFGERCEVAVGRPLKDCPGAGAAGGLGFALGALGGQLLPGATFVLNALALAETAASFDWIITGEGRSDSQTLLDKAPAIIARVGRKSGVPVTLVSGSIEHSSGLEAAFDGCFSIQPGPISLACALERAGELLEAQGRQLATLFGLALRRRSGADN